MWQRYLAVLLWFLLAAGCCSREETTPGPRQADAPAPTTPAVQKPVRTGDFGLPLEYTINVPEVPEELLRPSPPIEGSASPSAAPATEPLKPQPPAKSPQPMKDPSTPAARKP